MVIKQIKAIYALCKTSIGFDDAKFSLARKRWKNGGVGVYDSGTPPPYLILL